jgi:prepilin-type N-terminal cleavage/methylation domain-containing protein
MKTSESRGFSLIEMLMVTVILGIVMGLVTQILGSIQLTYREQQQIITAQDNARATLDFMTRLIRMAGNNPNNIANLQAIHPDPDGNNQLDSIRVRADWNPADGALNDRYEDVIFTSGSGFVYTQEPSDAQPVQFAEGLGPVSFSYFDSSNGSIADPIANLGSIAYVQVTLQTQVTGADPVLFRSGASIRKRESQ